MNHPFPAVIKDIRITPDGILATLDISPPDISTLSDLIDQEVTVTISAEHPLGNADAPGVASTQPEEKLPFEPEDDDLPQEPLVPKKRSASGRKRAE